MNIGVSVSNEGRHIEAALRRLDVSLAVAVRWQVTWVVMSLVVLVTMLEVGWYHNTVPLHNSPVCRVASVTGDFDNVTLAECLAVPSITPFEDKLVLLTSFQCLSSLLTVLLLASIVKYHHAHYLIKKLSDVEPVSIPFFRSAVFPSMLLECAVCAIHPFPGVDRVVSDVNVYLVFVFATFLRAYTLGRFRFHHSAMGQAPGRFIAGLTNVHLSVPFQLRAVLEHHPHSLTAAVYIPSFFMLAYMLRVAESAVCASSKMLQCTPLTYMDSLWTLFVTITTVGYGSPYVPVSSWGRIAVLSVSLLSFLAIAITVAFAIRWMRLDPMQSTVLEFISRHHELGELQECAAAAIQVAWRYQRLYAQSIEWREGPMGLSYRALSHRQPMEYHYLNTLARWTRQRHKVAQLASDGNQNYMWLLTNKVNQQVMEVKALIELYWERALPPHIRQQFDNHLLGLPLDFNATWKPLPNPYVTTTERDTAALSTTLYHGQDQPHARQHRPCAAPGVFPGTTGSPHSPHALAQIRSLPDSPLAGSLRALMMDDGDLLEPTPSSSSPLGRLRSDPAATREAFEPSRGAAPAAAPRDARPAPAPAPAPAPVLSGAGMGVGSGVPGSAAAPADAAAHAPARRGAGGVGAADDSGPGSAATRRLIPGSGSGNANLGLARLSKQLQQLDSAFLDSARSTVRVRAAMHSTTELLDLITAGVSYEALHAHSRATAAAAAAAAVAREESLRRRAGSKRRRRRSQVLTRQRPPRMRFRRGSV